MKILNKCHTQLKSNHPTHHTMVLHTLGSRFIGRWQTKQKQSLEHMLHLLYSIFPWFGFDKCQTFYDRYLCGIVIFKVSFYFPWFSNSLQENDKLHPNIRCWVLLCWMQHFWIETPIMLNVIIYITISGHSLWIFILS